MTAPPAIDLDVLVIGGGVAGLWCLDELRRAGVSAALVESSGLGAAQTGWSQGIIHGGLKYTLSGLFSESARAIREMPQVWRECLSGRREPDLSRVAVRAQHCFLWQTESLRSRAGMIGARAGLKVAPVALAREQRPEVLRECPGVVARLDEQVIDAFALVRELAARNSGRVWEGEVDSIAEVRATGGPGVLVQLRSADRGRHAAIRAFRVLLAAGAGNGSLRLMAGLDDSSMQIRPLHMAMACGRLPELNGHCIDGARTRVTITSINLADGRRVWQIGGQLAEEGVPLDAPTLIRRARRELCEVIPGFDPTALACEWSAYRADRAEGAAGRGGRPDDVVLLDEGPILTAWPTKLALAPRLAERVLKAVTNDRVSRHRGDGVPADCWPSARLAVPVWERAEWRNDEAAR